MSDYLRDDPFRTLTIATAAGFILGGGLKSRISLALLTFVGRIALRGAVTNAIVDLVGGAHDNGQKISASLYSERDEH